MGKNGQDCVQAGTGDSGDVLRLGQQLGDKSLFRRKAGRGNGHMEYMMQWRLQWQYCSDRISGGTSLISLLYSVLQFLPYYCALKIFFPGPLLSKCAPCAFILSECLSESLFSSSLCVGEAPTLVGCFLLAVNLSVAAAGVSATSTVCGDSLLNVWNRVWQTHINIGVP